MSLKMAWFTLKPASATKCFTRQQPAPRRPHAAVCSARPDDALVDAMLGAAGVALGAAAAAALALTPLPAEAVSGGGGMGGSMAFKDLSGQDLRKNNYTKGDLRGADLSGANLEGVRLFGAICVDAKFVGANLRGADLESAVFEGADLGNAVLEGAMLTNAQLGRVKNIAGADFTDALIRRDVQQGLCKIAGGTNPATGVETKESLGCP